MQLIILASGSPRRKALLTQIGLPFSVVVSHIDEEQLYYLSPTEMVKELSKQKAQKIATQHLDAVVIGADTTVELKGKVIAKPLSPEDAKEMLRLLSGKTHTVITGVTVVLDKKIITTSVATDVVFRKLSDTEIDAYVATGEPMDKAGGYGIQEKGAVFVEKINGDYANVVGLPITELSLLLKKIGIDITMFWKGGEK